MSRAAEVIREARRRSGLTQTQLAERSGLPQSVISDYERGRREPAFAAVDRLVAATDHVLALTRSDSSIRSAVLESGPRLRAALEPFGARNVRVFGSVARGEDTPSSDIDLLVDIDDGIGLFALLRMKRIAEDLLGRDVDLVPVSGLKPDVAERVLSEAVPL